MDKYLDQLYFDKRMTHWGISQGVISPQDLQKHLAQLEDLRDQAEVIQAPTKESLQKK